MPTPSEQAKRVIDRFLRDGNGEEHLNNLCSVSPKVKKLPPRIPGATDWTAEGWKKRLALLKQTRGTDTSVFENTVSPPPETLQGNIENYIGMTNVPTGVVGPLRVNGLAAKDDFYIPMATTEGALVASYQRGAWCVSQSGGVRAICSMEQVQRAPCFLFEDAIEATRFLAWVTLHLDDMKKAAASKTRHGSLQEVRISLNGNWTYLILGFETGDAAGQNMVTVCTDAVCRYILSASPVKPQHWYVEGNLSGDKKATAASFLFVRGRMVTAEATVKNDLIKKVLHTTAIDMVRYWTVSIVGGIQSGSIGVQGHFANGLAAIFLACGQDIACIAEAAVGVTRMSLTKEGDLYTSITLPNLIVGTVGGGTRFATQRACLAIMDCLGTDKARRFAEVCGAAVLAGEISIIGSLSAGDFSQAHASYGRPRGQ